VDAGRRQATAEIIQEEAGKIGVTIKVEALEPGSSAKASGTNKTFQWRTARPVAMTRGSHLIYFAAE
jgi:ABC-type transport system substrate-binding protein